MKTKVFVTSLYNNESEMKKPTDSLAALFQFKIYEYIYSHRKNNLNKNFEIFSMKISMVVKTFLTPKKNN